MSSACHPVDTSKDAVRPYAVDEAYLDLSNRASLALNSLTASENALL